MMLAAGRLAAWASAWRLPNARFASTADALRPATGPKADSWSKFACLFCRQLLGPKSLLRQFPPDKSRSSSLVYSTPHSPSPEYLVASSEYRENAYPYAEGPARDSVL